MDRAQRILASLGCCVIAIMGAFPPWHIQVPTTRIGDAELPARYRALGYCAIWAPPMHIDIWKPVPWTPPPRKERTPIAFDESDPLEKLRHSSVFDELKNAELEKAYDEERYGRNATIDVTRLSVQWLIVASLTLGIVVLLGMPGPLAAKATKPIVGTSGESDAACGSDVHAQV